jgi:protein TonB
MGGILIAPPPPPPLQTAEVPKPPERIRIRPNIQAGLLIHEVEPVYPLFARQARITGVVRLTAIIGPDGKIQSLELISGHPVLVRAAMDAVKQWVYKPTYFNGVAVEVLTEVIVNFHLS